MPNRCIVGKCSNTTKDGFTLHTFPKDEKTRRLWTLFVQDTRSDFKAPSPNSVICNGHFTPDCYDPSLELKRKLGFSYRAEVLPGKVPTLKLVPRKVSAATELEENVSTLKEFVHTPGFSGSSTSSSSNVTSSVSSMCGTNYFTRCPNVTEKTGSLTNNNVSSETVTLKKTVPSGEAFSHAIFYDGSDSSDEEEYDWVEVVELSCEAANDSVSSDKLPPHQSVEKHSQETKESAAHNSPPNDPKEGALFGHTTNTVIRGTNHSMVNIGGENDMDSDRALGASEFRARGTTVDGISLLQNDQLSYCPFCEKCYKGDLSEHCVVDHAKSVVVKSWLNEAKQTKGWMLKLMQNIGNFRHNYKVIRHGSGELIISQSVPEGSAPFSFTPCPGCLGFFNWKLLLEHKCESKVRKDFYSVMTVISDSQLLLPLSQEMANSVSSFVVNSAQEIGDTIAKDSLLHEFSHREFARINLDEEQSAQVKTNILDLSKFIAQLDEANMQQLILSGRSEEIVTGLKKFCESSKIEGKSGETFGKLISSLRKCGVVLRAKSLEYGNWPLQERSLKFIDLCDSWSLEPTGGSGNQESMPQVLTVDFVRILTEDVVQLWTYLCEVCTRHKELLMNSNTKVISSEVLKLLVTMSKVVFTKVFLFNKEEEESFIAKMKLADFRNCDPPRNGDVENCTSLNWRDHLLNSLVRVSVRNEAGIKRTILLTEDMVECINLLISKRDVAYVSPKNEDVFIFALFKSKGIPIRASDCVKEFSNNCSLVPYNVLMCPEVGKFVALAVQLTYLSRVNCKLVADYIANHIKVFKKSVTLHKETIQVFNLVKPLLDHGVSLSSTANNAVHVSSHGDLQEKRKSADGNAGFDINAVGTKKRKERLQTEGEDDHNSEHAEKERQETEKRREGNNLRVVKEMESWKNRGSTAMISTDIITNGQSEKNVELKEKSKQMLGDVHESVGIFAKMKNKAKKSAPVKRTKKKQLTGRDTGTEINAGDVERRKERSQTGTENDHICLEDRLKGIGAPEFVGVVTREREENQRYELRKVRIRNFKEKVERNVCRKRMKTRRGKISIDEEKCEDDSGSENEEKQGKSYSLEEEEEDLLKRAYPHLKVFISKIKLPGKKGIMKCKSHKYVLNRRTRRNVKGFCRNAAAARMKAKEENEANKNVAIRRRKKRQHSDGVTGIESDAEVVTRDREENQRYGLRKVRITNFKERLERNVCRARAKMRKEEIPID